MKNTNLTTYEMHYSEEKLWKKLISIAEKISRKTLVSMLTCFYAIMDENVPHKAKIILMGALGYLISPVDLLPDFLPGGFTDDFAVIAYAISVVAVYADLGRARSMAENKVAEILNLFKS